MYGLTSDDLDLQRRARAFADELIELRGDGRGERRPSCPTDVVARAPRPGDRARALRDQHARVELGGRGCTALQQVLVQEQAGRVTNGIAWCMAHSARRGGPRSPTTTSARRWLLPTVRGEMSECYAITEEDAGSDVSDLVATARRDGDEYVLNGREVARHVVQRGVLRLLPGRADRWPARRRPGAVRRRHGRAGRARRAHPGVHPHARPPPPDRRVRGRPGAGEPPRRAPRRTACRSSTSGSASSG